MPWWPWSEAKVTKNGVNWYSSVSAATKQSLAFIYSVEENLNTIIIIIINPLTARVVGAPQMLLQPVFSIFPCSPPPSGTCRTPGPSIPWCCLPTSSFVRLVFFPPFTVPCKMVLASPDERETWPYHRSLRLFTIVRRSSCGPIACWILARTWQVYATAEWSVHWIDSSQVN